MDVEPDLERARQDVLKDCNRILGGRALTEHELQTKLCAKGHEEHVVEWAVERCRVNRLLDDAAYAATFVRQRAARGHGPRKIRQDLARRGVDPSDVEAAFEAAEALEAEQGLEGAALERCVQLVTRRFTPAQLAETGLRAKAFRLLVSRGFDADAADRAIAAARARQD